MSQLNRCANFHYDDSNFNSKFDQIERSRSITICMFECDERERERMAKTVKGPKNDQGGRTFLHSGVL